MAMATARSSANVISGGVSFRREASVGNSANSRGQSRRPRVSHALKVTAIHSADPPAQAST